MHLFCVAWLWGWIFKCVTFAVGSSFIWPPSTYLCFCKSALSKFTESAGVRNRESFSCSLFPFFRGKSNKNIQIISIIIPRRHGNTAKLLSASEFIKWTNSDSLFSSISFLANYFHCHMTGPMTAKVSNFFDSTKFTFQKGKQLSFRIF